MKKQLITIFMTCVMGSILLMPGMGFADSEKGEITSGTIQVTTQSESEYPSMAQISMDQAVQAALKAVPGQILKVKIDDEDGFLVYGVEVVTPDNTIMEVMLDAGSGKVLAMHKDKKDHEYRSGHEEHDHEHEEHEREHEEHERD